MQKVELSIPHGPILNSEGYLIKYLTAKYDSIKIGTLDGFRSMEGSQADPMEGKIKGVNITGPANFTTEEFNKTAMSSNLKIVARDGIGFGETGKFTDDIARRVTNCHVYCCSYEIGSLVDQNRIRHFNAQMGACINDPYAFATHVGEHLRYSRDLNGNQIDVSRVSYNFHYAPVRYISRDRVNVNEINNLDLFVYQKDPKFVLEHELRFSWIMFDKQTHQQIYVHPDSVFVPLPQPEVYEYFEFTG